MWVYDFIREIVIIWINRKKALTRRITTNIQINRELNLQKRVDSEKMSADIDKVIEINVGGCFYTTTKKTLTSDKNSRLGELFDGDNPSSELIRDAKGRYVIDRDGFLFRYILDFLRDDTVQLPNGFREKHRLIREAEYFKLSGLIQCINALNDTRNGCITIGYRGSFQFGKGKVLQISS